MKTVYHSHQITSLKMPRKSKSHVSVKSIVTAIQSLAQKVKRKVALRIRFRATDKVSQSSPRKVKSKSVSYAWKTLQRKLNLIAAITLFAMLA